MSRNNSYYRRHFEENKDTFNSSVEQRDMDPETRNGVVVNAPYVKLREAPSKNAETIKLLKDGTELEILEFEKEMATGFKKVEVFVGKVKNIGYIASNFCKELD